MIEEHDRSDIAELATKVDVVVVDVVDYLIEKSDVLVIELFPNFDLVTHLIEAINHVCLTVLVILHAPLPLQRRLMHDLHRVFPNFGSPALLVLPGHDMDLAEGAAAYNFPEGEVVD